MIPTGLSFVPCINANYSFDYEKIVAEINETTDEKHLLHFMRYWCEEDLFFLLYFILRVPVNQPFLVDRIREVQDSNNRTLDLWAREFFKSTIITYGLNVQHIIRDPNVRIGIFSHTRSIAKAFLRRIKLTLESNDALKALFPDILYQNPTSQAPKWSEDDGIIVNRPSVFQESTVEAWGLTDGQPTSKHFSVLNYDDIVTIDSVRTADQLRKTDDCFKMSDNLGADDGIKRVIGTIYHFNDQHIKLMGQGGWIVRKHPAELADGTPTFLPEEKLAKKRRDLGPYVYSTQMLLNPIAKKDQRFRYEWLKWYRTLPEQLSLYLLCDPANEKKRKMTGNDYTVYWLWGLDSNDNRFLVDAIRDKLTLVERWKMLKQMRKKHPRIQRIGYEQYGMTADIQHFESMMEIEGNYFSHMIVELGGNRLSKEDRIARLIPSFEQGRVYLPEHLEYEDKEGSTIDLVQVFVNEEYLRFPFSQHDDLLDAASRIEDKVLEACKPLDDDWDDDVVQHDVGNFFNRVPREEESGRDYITGY
jgi:predicted phage terminase large subunit-like protein